jgi:serine/threonine-protein kinase
MASDEAAAPTTTDLETGEVLNGLWKLEEKIGEGGMGRVYRATDLKLARKAAVKALSVNNLDDETVKRFEREAQVMGKLDHPGVVTLYGVGRTRGVPWLAMKHLEGKGLWGILDDHGGQLPPAVLLPIARQLLVALGYIHERGLLHRDLKPSNIHVGPSGKTTLLDLGLARGHKSNLTRTGVIWGTPDYMAPEQIVGERQLDGRADLYSLSVVFYRMLSGVAPFEDSDEQELMRAHLMKPRPDISRLVPALSPLTGLALQKGLAIRPEDRFQTAEEMLIAIEKALAGSPREVEPTRANVGRAPSGAMPDITPKVGVRAPDVTPKAQPRKSGEKHKTEGRRITGEFLVPLADPVDPSDPVTHVDSSAPATKVEVAVPRASRPSAPRPPKSKPAAATPKPDPTPPRGPLADPSSTVVGDDDEVPVPPQEQITAPSDAVARPLPPQPAQLQLPAYLSPPFLIIGAALMLALGIILGKLL